MILILRTLSAALVLVLISRPALAYIGPGAGLGAIGAALGLLAAIVMAVGVVLFWPIRRLMRRLKSTRPASVPDTDPAGKDD